MISPDNKKILVTGGTGHLGSSIIHYLVNYKKISPENIRVFTLRKKRKMNWVTNRSLLSAKR